MCLFWGDGHDILENYTPFSVVPVVDGDGEFSFYGNRAVPPEASEIYARSYCPDSPERFYCYYTDEIPAREKQEIGSCIYRISLLSDLHLSTKTGRVMRALKKAFQGDCVLITGDLVNDGKPEQLKLFSECVSNSERDNVPLFCVGGNHDYPEDGLNETDFCYTDLQRIFLERNSSLGFKLELHESGCWSAVNEHIHIFGWKCVDERRNFFFGKKEKQLEWLSEKLKENHDKKYQIVCSHAPLIAHNPQRKPYGQPYFDSDTKLQSIIDSNKNIIFVSGHTHFSPNNLQGNVDYDKARNNIYIDSGSVCPATYKSDEPCIPEDWTDGVVTELAICENGVEIAYNSLHYGKRFARGYYRFVKERR